REDIADLVLHEIAEAGSIVRSRSNPFQNAVRRGYAEVCGNEQLSQGVERLDVHGPRTSFGCVRPTDDLVETLDDLLLGPGEAFFDPIEETHNVSASARCRRSISASIADRTSVRPSRTSAI